MNLYEIKKKKLLSEDKRRVHYITMVLINLGWVIVLHMSSLLVYLREQ
jgi:hypothetical protein